MTVTGLPHKIPDSPRIACLQGVRSADVVVLVLGPDYGFVPAGSTLSATHQEYREARDTRRILAFIQQDVDPDPQQKVFIDEVQAWEGGLYRKGFVDASDLQENVTQGLHDLTLADAVGPVDQDRLLADASALIPADARGYSRPTALEIALVGGPSQRIVRPLEMEDPTLAEQLEKSALYGEHRLFDRTKGTEVGLDGSDLLLAQDAGASIRLAEGGSLLFHLPLQDSSSRERRDSFDGLTIVEEVVAERLVSALGYAAATIERLDPTQRLTHVGIAAHISAAEYRSWRTRARQSASGGVMQVALGQQERRPIAIFVRRASLRLDRTPLVEDIVVPLRRQFSAG